MEKWKRALAAGTLGLMLSLSAPARTQESEPPVGQPPAGTTTTGAALATNATNATNGSSGTNGTVGTPATNAPTGTAGGEAAARENLEALRSYLRLQEQLHTALLAIQQSRAEASAEARTNVSAMLGRLEALERELAGQRAEESRASRNSNRLMMAAAAGMFLIGILAMILTAVIQARGMNRLAEIAMGMGSARGLPGLPGLPQSGALGLPGGDRLLLGASDGSGAEGNRLQSTIRQLENRIRDMELSAGSVPLPLDDSRRTGRLPHAPGTPARSPESENRPPMPDSNGHSASAAAPAHSRAVLLAKAQALISLDQPQAALATLEEAAERDPGDAELQVRRGMALERLKRFDEALAAYDRAISLDARCTQAYLSKGGILNQQARFQEALACYEQALQQKTRST